MRTKEKAQRIETALLAFGMCMVVAIAWHIRELEQEREAEKFVARELERIRESLKSQR